MVPPLGLQYVLPKLREDNITKEEPFVERPIFKEIDLDVPDDNYQPQRIDSIVFSSQHDPDLSLEQLRELVREEIIQKTLPQDLIDDKTKFFIN